PIFSVGIVLAMFSAYAAAWAIDRSLCQPTRQDAYQAIFTRQMHGRLELSRTLALPGYQATGLAGTQAREAFHFAAGQAQALRHVAARVTAGGANVAALAGAETRREAAPGP